MIYRIFKKVNFKNFGSIHLYQKLFTKITINQKLKKGFKCIKTGFYFAFEAFI